MTEFIVACIQLRTSNNVAENNAITPDIIREAAGKGAELGHMALIVEARSRIAALKHDRLFDLVHVDGRQISRDRQAS